MMDPGTIDRGFTVYESNKKWLSYLTVIEESKKLHSRFNSDIISKSNTSIKILEQITDEKTDYSGTKS
jgi:hypothetical protein